MEMYQNGQDENAAFFWHQICCGSHRRDSQPPVITRDTKKTDKKAKFLSGCPRRKSPLFTLPVFMQFQVTADTPCHSIASSCLAIPREAFAQLPITLYMLPLASILGSRAASEHRCHVRQHRACAVQALWGVEGGAVLAAAVAGAPCRCAAARAAAHRGLGVRGPGISPRASPRGAGLSRSRVSCPGARWGQAASGRCCQWRGRHRRAVPA